MKYFKIIYIIGIMIILTLSCGQGKKAGPDTTVEEIIDSGEVVYADGLVTCARETGELELEEGDEILPGDTIVVGENSSCDIQFGEISIVHLEENTTVKASTLIIQTEETDISLGLITGTVLCKVEKLTEKESFDVETKTATCGVRGTEFMVTEDNEGSSLSVKTGKVALVPGGQEIKEMKRSLRESGLEKSEELIELMESLEESAEIVENDEELTIKKEDVATIKKKTTAMKTLIKEAKGKKKIPDTQWEELHTMIKETDGEIKKIKKTKLTKAAISEKNKEKLKKTEKLKLRELKRKKKTKKDEDADGKIPVRIQTIPADALIYINGELAGKGKVAERFEDAAILNVRVEKDGFIPEELSVEVKKGMDIISIRLKKEKNEAGSKTPGPKEKQKGKDTGKGDDEDDDDDTVMDSMTPGSLMVRTRPEGAMVSVDDIKVGESPCTITDLTPGYHALRIQSKGYDEIVRRIEIKSGETTTESITLKRTQ